MFNMFRSSKQVRNKSAGSSKKLNTRENQLNSKRDGILEKQVMEGAERELYRYDQPTQELGMSDLIKNHEHGTRFMYAVITGKESEEMESKMRRLISFQPRMRKKAVPIDNLPIIKLFRETESFPLEQVIPSIKKGGHLGDYMRVSDAVVLYGAVVSPDCHFTKVTVGITDTRLLTDKIVKSFTAATNVASRGNLALPYCIPRSEADCLVLTISRERAFLEEGRQWGAIQIELILEFCDFPAQYSNQPVAALNMVTNSALEKPVNNPNNIDISMLNQDRLGLAELYLEGDLADENEPIENKVGAVKYAKSSIAGIPKGKKLEPVAQEWKFLSDKRIGQIDLDKNSIDPDEEGSINYNPPSIRSISSDSSETQTTTRPPTPPMKSAMKSPDRSDDEPKRKVMFNKIDRLTPF